MDETYFRLFTDSVDSAYHLQFHRQFRGQFQVHRTDHKCPPYVLISINCAYPHREILADQSISQTVIFITPCICSVIRRVVTLSFLTTEGLRGVSPRPSPTAVFAQVSRRSFAIHSRNWVALLGNCAAGSISQPSVLRRIIPRLEFDIRIDRQGRYAKPGITGLTVRDCDRRLCASTNDPYTTTMMQSGCTRFAIWRTKSVLY